jgi:ABC-2 type transport system ATP-binding protein
VLYLDEPTIGLDPVVKDRIRRAVRSMNRELGTTVVLTTHDLSDIEELCHRIVILDRGRKVYDGSQQALREAHGAIRTVEMDLVDAGPIAGISLAEALGVPEASLSASITASTLVVRLDRNAVSVPELIACVFRVARVVDVRIRDASIEDIVKGLYG